MRVVYSPPTSPTTSPRDGPRRPRPSERGRGPGRAHPRRAGCGRRLRRCRARRSTARPRSPRSTTRAWSRSSRTPGRSSRGQTIPRPFLRPRRSHLAMFEGMAPRLATLLREPPHLGGRAGHWGLDTSTPLVAGTYDAARAAVDVALTTVDLVLGRRASRLRAVPAAGPPRRPVDVRRLLLLQQRRDRGPGDHAAHGRAGLDPRRRLPPRQRQRADLLAPRRRALRLAPRASRTAQYPYFLGWEDETGEGDGAGANLNLPLPAGATTRPTSWRWTAASTRSRTSRAPSWWCRSGSTRTAATRSATSRSRPRVSRDRAAGRAARAAAGDPPGGRLLPAGARRQRPGVAARRRGTPLRPAAVGRVQRRGSVAG